MSSLLELSCTCSRSAYCLLVNWVLLHRWPQGQKSCTQSLATLSSWPALPFLMLCLQPLGSRRFPSQSHIFHRIHSLLSCVYQDRLLTGLHSWLSIRLRQESPHPGPPSLGGRHWQTMMSSSFSSLRDRCVKMFSVTCCQTAGLCVFGSAASCPFCRASSQLKLL